MAAMLKPGNNCAAPKVSSLKDMSAIQEPTIIVIIFLNIIIIIIIIINIWLSFSLIWWPHQYTNIVLFWRPYIQDIIHNH